MLTEFCQDKNRNKILLKQSHKSKTQHKEKKHSRLPLTYMAFLGHHCPNQLGRLSSLAPSPIPELVCTLCRLPSFLFLSLTVPAPFYSCNREQGEKATAVRALLPLFPSGNNFSFFSCYFMKVFSCYQQVGTQCCMTIG